MKPRTTQMFKDTGLSSADHTLNPQTVAQGRTDAPGTRFPSPRLPPGLRTAIPHTAPRSPRPARNRLTAASLILSPPAASCWPTCPVINLVFTTRTFFLAVTQLTASCALPPLTAHQPALYLPPSHSRFTNPGPASPPPSQSFPNSHTPWSRSAGNTPLFPLIPR